MAEVSLSRVEWQVSTQNGNCAEVARPLPGLVVARCSK